MMLDRIYKFKWVRRKVKWNDDKKLKCENCGHIFEVGEWAYLYYSKYLGEVENILCESCFKEMKNDV